MKNCDKCALSRRQFLRAAGGAAVCWAMLPVSERVFADELASRTPIFPKPKADVTLVFSHIPTGNPTWPSKDYDYAKREKELTDKLVAACPKINFTAKTAISAEQANAIVKESPKADGYVVYALGIWTGALNAIARSGKPTVLVDDLYAGSGEILNTGGAVMRAKLPVAVVSSSDFNDVVSTVRLFEVIRGMKESVILDIVNYDTAAPAGQIEKVYGAKVVRMTSDELNSYYSKADQGEAAKWAESWIKNAKKVVEPSREEITKSGKMYLALCNAVADKKADAVSVDCLGLFYSGKLPAYPCLSHFQMNNDGGTGVCEGDLNSTCTQLAMRYLTGRPGYVSDPVIDTSKSEIIYAHCVSTNRVFGPGGKPNPYIIRSHAEDGKGAVVQSLMPAGEPVTTLEMDVWSKRIVVHTAKTTRNVDEPKACRTKLAAKTDAQQILDNWDMGWHRVTFYGDWRRNVIDLARLMGFTVLEEDKA